MKNSREEIVPVMSSNAQIEELSHIGVHGWRPVVEVIIPTKNEADMLDRVLLGVKEYADRIVVVDGHSHDGTLEIAKTNGVETMIQKGVGKGAALREAFRIAKGDIVIIMDADGSMRPEEVPLFLKAIASGADVVKGSRFSDGGFSEDMTLIRKIGNLFFLLLVNSIWSTRYTDLCYGFKAFTKVGLERLRPFLKSINFDIETEICIRSNKLGLKVVEVPSVELKRVHGNSNLKTMLDGARILKRILHELIQVS